MAMDKSLLMAALAAAFLPLAGCVADADEGMVRLHGTFTADPRPDWDAFEDLVAQYTDESAAILESFPEQFLIDLDSMQDCEALRAKLDQKPWVASVGDCERVEAAGDGGDGPVGSDE